MIYVREDGVLIGAESLARKLREFEEDTPCSCCTHEDCVCCEYYADKKAFEPDAERYYEMCGGLL